MLIYLLIFSADSFLHSKILPIFHIISNLTTSSFLLSLSGRFSMRTVLSKVAFFCESVLSLVSTLYHMWVSPCTKCCDRHFSSGISLFMIGNLFCSSYCTIIGVPCSRQVLLCALLPCYLSRGISICFLMILLLLAFSLHWLKRVCHTILLEGNLYLALVDFDFASNQVNVEPS